MFGTMLLIVWTLLHLYVFGRAATIPALTRRIPRRILFAAAGVFWSTFVAGRLLGGDSGGPAAAFLEMAGMYILATLFLAATALLAVDVVTGFGFFARRHAPALRGLALVAGLGMAAIAVVQGTRTPAVHSFEVRLAGLPAALDGTAIVALADFHLGSMLDGEWLAARVAQVEALRPDVVVLLGDILEGHGGPREALVAGLRRFSAPLGVFAVTGNHEYYGGRGENDRTLDNAGFRVLHDSWAEVRPGLVLAGVDDLTARRRTGTGEGAVEGALAGRPPGAVVFLSHSPLQVERAAGAGAGLMLSGHTHGGQIWPFGYLVRLSYPYMAGRYDVAGMTLLVSRGTGTWGPRMRLWQRGEILRIVLRAPDRRT